MTITEWIASSPRRDDCCCNLQAPKYFATGIKNEGGPGSFTHVCRIGVTRPMLRAPRREKRASWDGQDLEDGPASVPSSPQEILRWSRTAYPCLTDIR